MNKSESKTSDILQNFHVIIFLIYHIIIVYYSYVIIVHPPTTTKKKKKKKNLSFTHPKLIQTCMRFFLLLSKKNILKNVDNQTFASL